MTPYPKETNPRKKQIYDCTRAPDENSPSANREGIVDCIAIAVDAAAGQRIDIYV